MKSLNPWVFFPPLIFLAATVVFSLSNAEHFLRLMNIANAWVLERFGWLFSWATLAFLLILAMVYFSPLAKVRIGGSHAEPILSKWRWFAITLCTTVATGILFWGPAEPLYHLNEPPAGLGFTPGDSKARQFAMSTMFMHWTLTPYGIYTIAGLVFALSYYNLRQPFSLGALLYPVLGRRAHGLIGTFTDIICLYGLVAGMAASLGTGILTLMGGMNIVLGIPPSSFLLAIIGLAIVVTFVISAASGLMRGIRVLSDYNIKAFMGLAIFIFLAGPTLLLLKMGWAGLVDYVYHFLPRSLNIQTGIDKEWQNSWTIFYWANWLAWTPITALFLGQLARGYTVRDYIHYNLLWPALFGGVWMMIFGGTSMAMDQAGDGFLYQILSDKGEQNVIFSILGELPLGGILSVVFLFIVFVSYVTAADSNTSAMSGMSTHGISPENPEAPLWIKVVWGSLIGIIAWVMITYAGVDGIRMLSVLGGFPALFLVLLVSVGILHLVFRRAELFPPEKSGSASPVGEE